MIHDQSKIKPWAENKIAGVYRMSSFYFTFRLYIDPLFRNYEIQGFPELYMPISAMFMYLLWHLHAGGGDVRWRWEEGVLHINHSLMLYYFHGIRRIIWIHYKTPCQGMESIPLKNIISFEFRLPGNFNIYFRQYCGIIMSGTPGCTRQARRGLILLYLSLGMRQLFGDITVGQWRHNRQTWLSDLLIYFN